LNYRPLIRTISILSWNGHFVKLFFRKFFGRYAEAVR